MSKNTYNVNSKKVTQQFQSPKGQKTFVKTPSKKQVKK